MPTAPKLNRRKFLAASAATAAVTIVPRHVLGQGQTPPSEKLTMALIGCGTQGLSELMRMLPLNQIQMVAVCDPNKDSEDYVEWSKGSIRRTLATGVGQPNWRQNAKGPPGGREVGKELIDLYYSDRAPNGSFKGCTAYTDFRELLEKSDGIDAVKIMTPDHLHATIAIAAMKKGKHTMVHKPLANRVNEARLVIDTARKTKVATHFIPAESGGDVATAVKWIRDGAIGKLREIHNWSNRPMWPQYTTLPTDRPEVPKGFDWDLWLGPAQDRAYHPHFTHAVFRGWYEFGGGSLCDMGHYSLCRVFQELNLDAPIAVESNPSHVCQITDHVSTRINNDFSFPIACTIRWKFAAKGDRPAVDLFWYDGSMKPPTPDELEAENGTLVPEGMMFVGETGKILGGFRGENPRILGKSPAPAPAPQNTQRTRTQDTQTPAWVSAFKGGPPTLGNFLLHGAISEAFNLAAISLRNGGKRLQWDAAAAKITNLPAANKYLGRDYRKGWELAAM